jgi:hypothetical protein
MRQAAIFFVFMLLSSSSFSQNWIHPADVLKHRGKIVNFIGLVTHTEHFTSKKESFVLIYIGGNDSSEAIRLLVPKADRPNFKVDPETIYLGQYVQVRGKVESYKGKPQIIIQNDKQIAIARETPPEE